ncbi:hypothetical protein AK812_SmicGene5129 [Symbiodinium microadriaticum]|uniref:Uncharacterized protein n=1 Tax=Symbiodinium microadriaticum TaxID=2951 RepID=A0A1Q9EUH6_SYMMI|nr:hypothetical protein AK812_SmicGene5129 [Symbiodinium microadriaticum]
MAAAHEARKRRAKEFAWENCPSRKSYVRLQKHQAAAQRKLQQEQQQRLEDLLATAAGRTLNAFPDEEWQGLDVEVSEGISLIWVRAASCMRVDGFEVSVVVHGEVQGRRDFMGPQVPGSP